MKQHDIAALFNQMADLLEFRGANPFRIRAYRKAAQNLESLTRDLDRLAQEDRLTEIPGIGADLAGKIREYLAHGAIKDLERLKQVVPQGVLACLEIPGVGPKTAKVLYERLRITSVPQLEAAARAHKLVTLPGFQSKKEENILKGIEIVTRGQARMDLGRALALAHVVRECLRRVAGVRRCEVAGSLRRMKETIGDLDVLVATSYPARVTKAFVTAPFCARVLASGQTKSSILTTDGVQVDLRVVEPACFGAALQYFTGSKEHNVHLREMAVRKGLKINEYGVFRVKTGARIAGREEEDVYKATGLPWIPPELREDNGEIEAALKGRLPRLVTEQDLCGDFHLHTNKTDGKDTLETMVETARARGYRYVAICDHSQSLTIANGLSEAALKNHMARMAALNTRFRGFRILRGSEVDILNRGAMDYPNELLRQLDFVIGSIHSGFKQDEATITSRIVKAMENPYVTMIAHPTGRLMGQREPYAVDLERIFDVARETHTALELNAQPKRLDLSDAMARRASDRGVMLGISTDSHSKAQLHNIALGLGIARRAWLQPNDLLNCLELQPLLRWIGQKRRRAAA